MSHGVNRAILKEGKTENRVNFLKKLISKSNGIKYDFYGYKNKQPVWADNFKNALLNSKNFIDQFSNNLKKESIRIPIIQNKDDFKKFVEIGLSPV